MDKINGHSDPEMIRAACLQLAVDLITRQPNTVLNADGNNVGVLGTAKLFEDYINGEEAK